MVKVTSEKSLKVTFDSNNEPQFKFSGDWNIRDLVHTRTGLFRAYKHYIREIRVKEAK